VPSAGIHPVRRSPRAATPRDTAITRDRHCDSRIRFDRVLGAPHDTLPQVATHLEAARDDVLAFTTFRKKIWPQL
jgi:transposase-like protein